MGFSYTRTTTSKIIPISCIIKAFVLFKLHGCLTGNPVRPRNLLLVVGVAAAAVVVQTFFLKSSQKYGNGMSAGAKGGEDHTLYTHKHIVT